MIASFLIIAAAAAGMVNAQSNCRGVINNVMTIILENEDAADVMQDSYFGTTLAQQGYILNNMNGVAHPSQPNYIAMIAGDTLGVTGDGN
ncbi:hypothetical protein HDU76_009244, partial [Blyttiomyces sp. JEL0837]